MIIGEYYRIWDTTLQGLSANDLIGVFNVDFERKTITDSDENVKYYYPKTQLGSYTSIINQTNRDERFEQVDGNVYQYLNADSKRALAKVYYTALGRERYAMYKTYRNAVEFKNQFT